MHKGALYVLDNDSLNRVEADKSLKVLAAGMPGGADGLENVKGDDFLVSVWSGAVWYVKADGSKELLFDGKAVETKHRRHRLGSRRRRRSTCPRSSRTPSSHSRSSS